jgi:hypothetical protein
VRLKGPETWLSRGLANLPDPSPDSEQSNDPASQDLNGEPTMKEFAEVVEDPSREDVPVITDPYQPVSSHWMAPSKIFAKVRGFDAAARRAHLIRIETNRALDVNREIEVIGDPTLEE